MTRADLLPASARELNHQKTLAYLDGCESATLETSVVVFAGPTPVWIGLFKWTILRFYLGWQERWLNVLETQ